MHVWTYCSKLSHTTTTQPSLVEQPFSQQLVTATACPNFRIQLRSTTAPYVQTLPRLPDFLQGIGSSYGKMNMLRGFLCVTGLLACLAVTSGQFIPRQTNSATLVARSDCVNAIEQVQNHWLQAFSVAKQGHTQLVDACLRVKLECQAPGQQRSWSWGVWLAVLAATVTTLCCYIYIRALHQQNCLQKNQLTARVRHFESQWLHAQREAFEYSQVLHAAFNEESQLYEDICGAVVQDAVKSPAKCQSTHPYKTCIDKVSKAVQLLPGLTSCNGKLVAFDPSFC